MRTCIVKIVTGIIACMPLLSQGAGVPPVVHSKIGATAAAPDGAVSLKVIAKKQNFDWSAAAAASRDSDVLSPKSVNFSPDGKKFYVNSLEGCMTLVYDAKTNKKLKVIRHKFDEKDAKLWSKPSGLFPFTHYSKNLNTFWGRPVESAFSHKGRYLWVPYYRRSYDLNAQDPSAVAIIDTRSDSIIRLMETGPLPKMVACSHDGRHMAISHWGNNTVGIIDISSASPNDWHYVSCVTIDYKLNLNYSLTAKVDRDSGSGYMLRGTVYTPDDRYLLVGCMGGAGGIGVIDMKDYHYVGRITGINNARHLVMTDKFLFASRNSAGIVQKIPLDSVLNCIHKMEQQGAKTGMMTGWIACQVGTGTRTIELSPSGNFAFAACNSASKLCVIDTRTMKMIASIDIDSYPVGLDISRDGSKVIVTSQGRQGCGGNAVNIVEVTYAEPEPDITEKPEAASGDEASDEPDGAKKTTETGTDTRTLAYIGIGVFALLALGLIATLFMRRRRKK